MLIYVGSYFLMIGILWLIGSFMVIRPYIRLALYLVFFVLAWLVTKHFSRSEKLLAATMSDVNARTQAQKKERTGRPGKKKSAKEGSLQKEKTGV